MIQETNVRRSALWAAYGDALGFITELASESLVKQRIGAYRAEKMQEWTRRIGGKFGSNVLMPAGCYSDDTQLRLSTSRCIRGDGTFDVEVFAKVELPVWSSYALGAGLGSKAAAEWISRPGSRWSSNFYEGPRGSYFNGGGNGAAMRIQPHVWSARGQKTRLDDIALRDISRNAITTHGHPRGFVGAVFHAMCLYHAVSKGRVFVIEELCDVAESMSRLSDIMGNDSELGIVWLPVWERSTGKSLRSGIDEVVAEMLGYLRTAKEILKVHNERESYHEVAHAIGAMDRESVGSGSKTSALASIASILFSCEPREGISEIANLKGSDTDTIATMTGAIIGAICECDPPEMVQDAEYISQEAARMFRIACGERVTDGFDYPDLLYWQVPKAQIDFVGIKDKKWFLAGLGELTPLPESFPSGKDAVWQWFRLSTGQTILLKRREQPKPLPSEALPLFQEMQAKESTIMRNRETEVPDVSKNRKRQINAKISANDAADDVIRAMFDPKAAGEWLIRLSEEENGVDLAIAFAAIVAKARNARALRERYESKSSSQHAGSQKTYRYHMHVSGGPLTRTDIDWLMKSLRVMNWKDLEPGSETAHFEVETKECPDLDEFRRVAGQGGFKVVKLYSLVG